MLLITVIFNISAIASGRICLTCRVLGRGAYTKSTLYSIAAEAKQLIK